MTAGDGEGVGPAAAEEGMIIHVHTPVHNEAALLPWHLAHYETFADRIFLYDGGSTDGTRQIAAAHPKVTLNDCPSDELRDDLLSDLKANCWKGLGADWVVVCDADELLYSADIPMRRRLEGYARAGTAAVRPVGYDMTGRHVPAYSPGAQIYDTVRKGKLSDNYSKCCLFHAWRVGGMTYGAGCHEAEFVLRDGSVLRGQTLDRPLDLCLLHYRRLGGPEAYLAQRQAVARRVSAVNRARGWSWHCLRALREPEFVKQDYLDFENWASVVPHLEDSHRPREPGRRVPADLDAWDPRMAGVAGGS